MDGTIAAALFYWGEAFLQDQHEAVCAQSLLQDFCVHSFARSLSHFHITFALL